MEALKNEKKAFEYKAYHTSCDSSGLDSNRVCALLAHEYRKEHKGQ